MQNWLQESLTEKGCKQGVRKVKVSRFPSLFPVLAGLSTEPHGKNKTIYIYTILCKVDCKTSSCNCFWHIIQDGTHCNKDMKEEESAGLFLLWVSNKCFTGTILLSL